MDRETARGLVAGYTLTTASVATPFWPDLDGLVSVRAMTGTESFAYENAEKTDVATGKVLCATILLTENKSPIFNATDFQWVMDTVGVDAIKPLFYKVLELSGMLKTQPTEADVAA